MMTFRLALAALFILGASAIGGIGFPSEMKPLVLKNRIIELTLDPRDWSFVATDKRNGEKWRSLPCDDRLAIVSAKRKSDLKAELECTLKPEGSPVRLEVSLDRSAPEFSVTTIMQPDAAFGPEITTVPIIRESGKDWELVVPVGDGMLFPTDDPELRPLYLPLAEGNAITMPWFGVTNKRTGAAAMCFTRDIDDAFARVRYLSQDELKAGVASFIWQPQKGRWGYNRTVRFYFVDKGGYVALAKRYRMEAISSGQFVSLAAKRKKLPQIEKLCGAMVMYLLYAEWGGGNEQDCKETIKWLHDRGVERMLHTSMKQLRDTTFLKELGYLSNTYDEYYDIWDPKEAAKAGYPDRTWGFPDDVLTLVNGTQMRGWVQHTPDGDIPSYFLCGTQHLKWAKRRIPSGVRRIDDARFVDCTAAIFLLECYNPQHPCTRAEDRQTRLELLKYVGDLGLICGSEAGNAWAVPVACWFEGVMSPVQFRHPIAGYLPDEETPVPDILKYQLNPAVHVPLWELVFHDAAVATWYWGDCTNTFPSVWSLRNAFNALYATPPLFVLKRKQQYLDQRDRIVETYKFLKPVYDAVGFSEMTSHRFLSDDRKLQLSEFANGVKIVVNFSDAARVYRRKSVLPLGYAILR